MKNTFTWTKNTSVFSTAGQYRFKNIKSTGGVLNIIYTINIQNMSGNEFVCL